MALMPKIEAFLQQEIAAHSDFELTTQSLQTLANQWKY